MTTINVNKQNGSMMFEEDQKIAAMKDTIHQQTVQKDRWRNAFCLNRLLITVLS
jgi:hypothetical protein